MSKTSSSQNQCASGTTFTSRCRLAQNSRSVLLWKYVAFSFIVYSCTINLSSNVSICVILSYITYWCRYRTHQLMHWWCNGKCIWPRFHYPCCNSHWFKVVTHITAYSAASSNLCRSVLKLVNLQAASCMPQGMILNVCTNAQKHLFIYLFIYFIEIVSSHRTVHMKAVIF